ncbi:hypothetical protein ATI61_109210 [Archangium gephyra]|uniref:Glycoprotein gp2 n=1 Tax=Archangium gephyra TaxID=48 RepID=A0AAC8Q286_9BACT|nr:choice-of-anchor D domain-containing protein [Archangium gephyra]AKI99598.1 Glycoprotein gp2 [Archangium gephyra]REG27869.1 hypothetical protein ATI61_109210 [Archangium gephyra]
MILGIGTDNSLLMRKTPQAPWEKLGSRQPALAAVTVLRNGVILGVGMDTLLWKQDLSGTYKQIPNSQAVKGAAMLPDGTLLGVGMDNQLWARVTLTTTWCLVPGSGPIISIAVMPDGRILGVGTDNQLRTRATLTSPWTVVPGSGAVKSVAVTPEGTLVGVGLDNVLHTRATLTSPWTVVPGSGPVLSVAAYPVACDTNSTATLPPPPVARPVLELFDGASKVAPGAPLELGTLAECTTGAPRTFVIKNTGTAPLKLLRIELSNPTDFLLGPLASPPVDLAPGASMSFELRFSPKSAGRKSATVNLVSTDATTPLFPFTVAGTATAKPKAGKLVVKQYYSYTSIYEVPIAPNSHHVFREPRPGDAFQSLSFYIENQGEGDLQLLNATLSNTAAFVLTEMTGTPTGPRPRFPKVLRPGGREILYLVYTRRGPGPQTTTLQLQSGSPGQQPELFQFTVQIP